jgi:hypothetical protein
MPLQAVKRPVAAAFQRADRPEYEGVKPLLEKPAPLD